MALLLASAFGHRHHRQWAGPGWAPTPHILQSLPELSYLLALQRPHAPAAQSAQRSPAPRTDGGEDTPLSPRRAGQATLASSHPPPAGPESGCLSASPLCFPLLGDQRLLQTLLVNPSQHRLPWGPRRGWDWLITHLVNPGGGFWETGGGEQGQQAPCPSEFSEHCCLGVK